MRLLAQIPTLLYPALAALVITAAAPATFAQKADPRNPIGTAPRVPVAPPTVPTMARAPSYAFSHLAASSAQSAVLVIPGPTTEPNALPRITEDLTVMCRIFDRRLEQARLRPACLDSFGNYYRYGTSRYRALGELLPHATGGTSALCVDGYGPVFLLQVDFPVVGPPADQKHDPAPETDPDPLWTQMRRDIYAPPAPGHGHPQQSTGQPYEPERVDLLKITLIQTLRHARNIRGLSEEAHVTILARGPVGGSRGSDHTQNPGREPWPQPNAGATTTLVLRAGLKDITPFAAGKMSVEEFQKRVRATQY